MPTPQRHDMSTEMKVKILERDGYICVYCGYPAECVDHIVPYSYFPDNSESNLVAACDFCNQIALDKVFSSLSEKSCYIRDVRKKGKWAVRYRRRSFIPCADCGRMYRNIGQATAVLCEECAIKEYGERGRQKRGMRYSRARSK